jgi:hypothetical protein
MDRPSRASSTSALKRVRSLSLQRPKLTRDRAVVMRDNIHVPTPATTYSGQPPPALNKQPTSYEYFPPFESYGKNKTPGAKAATPAPSRTVPSLRVTPASPRLTATEFYPVVPPFKDETFKLKMHRQSIENMRHSRTKQTRAMSTTDAFKSASTSASSTTEATPLLSRPMLNRAITTNDPVVQPQAQRPPTTSKPGRPCFLRRATDYISGQTSPQLQPPSSPTHWVDSAHRKPLVKTWDRLREAAAQSKEPTSTSSILSRVENTFLHDWPELAYGAIPLSKDWIEYILGTSLRHPFSSSQRMGRFEQPYDSAGSRGVWGPW